MSKGNIIGPRNIPTMPNKPAPPITPTITIIWLTLALACTIFTSRRLSIMLIIKKLYKSRPIPLTVVQ